MGVGVGVGWGEVLKRSGADGAAYLQGHGDAQAWDPRGAGGLRGVLGSQGLVWDYDSVKARLHWRILHHLRGDGREPSGDQVSRLVPQNALGRWPLG